MPKVKRGMFDSAPSPTVEANLERQKAEKPESPLIIAAHPAADTEALVTILDAAKAVGIDSVSVATSTR